MNQFLEIVYYDAAYDGIFVSYSHEEMLTVPFGDDDRYEVLEINLIIEDV
jgi:hypothetical protein